MNLIRKSELSRAEQIRQRRTQTSAPSEPKTPARPRPVTQTRTRTETPAPRRTSATPTRRQAAATPSRTRPVVARGGYGAPIVQQARTKTRRQLYYNISATGVEVRLPSLPIIRPDWRMLSGALAVALFVAIMLVWNAPSFQVGLIQVEGLQRVTADELNAVLGLQGMSVLELDVNELNQKLAVAFPELTNVRVNVSLPAQVTLSVTERQPILTWVYGDKTLWIDGNGIIIPARGEISDIPVVIATDAPPILLESEAAVEGAQLEVLPAAFEEALLNNWGRQVDPQVLLTALKLRNVMPEGAELAYSQRHGLGWEEATGTFVYIGHSLDEIDLKLVEAQAILQELANQGHTPTVVSVETVHAPYYRMEQ
ncbi:MAG TPA: FtsQ-type POTRA domain-containing protein [Anaerolineaceae bacterium]|nr:FtsQ-type POTRA domain-containing protein [Anaerolineaceae bacterium]HOD03958.1 FtsQ-type POTRA domain-containing protein [Anaerolineaceae bacterium]